MATLRNTTAVVTGAASGIGRALARELDARGCRLALSDIDLDGCKETAAACRDARAYHLDVADRDAVFAHAEEVVADLGEVHVMVNNAGVALTADALEQTTDDITWLLDINLRGVIHGTQAFLPHLIESGDGHLVNLSSIFGIIGMPMQSAYNAAKFGVRGYTESIAIEMAIAKHPVTVHVVHPGGIKTNIANNARVAPTRDRTEFRNLFNNVLARTSPEAAARTIVRGVERGKRRIFIGADAYAMHLMQQVLGHRYQHLLALTAGRMLGETRQPPITEDTSQARTG